MKTKVHMALNHWLQKADENYLEGRVLWFNLLLDGACILFWLGIEQALKIVVLQDKIAEINSTCKDFATIYEGSR